MSTEDKNIKDTDQYNCDTIRELVKNNKASALGLAVLFALGTITAGCNKPSVQKPSASIVEKDYEEEDEDDNTYVGGGGHGYYYWRSGPEFKERKTYWGKNSQTFHGSGYSFVRGGSIGG